MTLSSHGPLPPLHRRGFLATSAALAAGTWLMEKAERTAAADDDADADGANATEERPLPRVAAINTVYRFRSHAYHIAGRFINGYSREGVHHQPPFKLAFSAAGTRTPEAQPARGMPARTIGGG